MGSEFQPYVMDSFQRSCEQQCAQNSQYCTVHLSFIKQVYLLLFAFDHTNTHITIDPTICCLEQTHFKYEDTDMLKLKDGGIHHDNINQKKSEVAVISADIRARKIITNFKRAVRNDKESVLKDNIAIL